VESVGEPALRAQAALGEGPLWDDSEQALWWVDVESEVLHCYSPDTGHDRHYEIGQRVSAVVRRERGGLLLALQNGIAKFNPESEEIELVCDPEADLAENRFNDGKCDPGGRLWAGTMNLAPDRFSTGALYSFDGKFRVKKHLSNVGVSNGLAWSADAKTMFYVDTMIRTIDAFDYNSATGEIANRRAVFEVPLHLGMADGMTIDTDDNLWVAFWGGWCLAQIDPRLGIVLRRISFPVANVTSCAFGGNDLDELYVTTARLGLDDAALRTQPCAGDLFMFKPGVQGRQLTAFRD
jgi:sugar lactone lactonase YvrE